MALDTGLFTPQLTAPKYSNHVILSYEGKDWGIINIIHPTGQTSMLPGDVLIVETDNDFLQTIAKLTDPTSGNPPLRMYRLRHVV